MTTRNITLSLMLIILLIGGILIWQNNRSLRRLIERASRGNEITVFESRYLSQDLPKKDYKDITLLFFPYLMMEVKFPGNDGKAGHGILLWSLTSGEAVINGDTWEMTRGFAQALSSKPSKDAFRLMQVISLYGGSVSKELLEKQLRLHNGKLDEVINEAIDKKFVINNVRSEEHTSELQSQR